MRLFFLKLKLNSPNPPAPFPERAGETSENSPLLSGEGPGEG